jgi:hypothetical protein
VHVSGAVQTQGGAQFEQIATNHGERTHCAAVMTMPMHLIRFIQRPLFITSQRQVCACNVV